MSVAVIGHALDALPGAHRALWLGGRDALRRWVRHRWATGCIPDQIAVVIADAGAEVAQAVGLLSGVEILQAGSDETPFVALGVNRAATRILSGWPCALLRLSSLPRPSMLLLTAPIGSTVGASTISIIERRRLD